MSQTKHFRHVAFWILYAFFTALAVSGCSGTGHRHRELEKRINGLEQEVDTLKSCAKEFGMELDTMEDSLRQISQQLKAHQRGFEQYASHGSLNFGGFLVDVVSPGRQVRISQAIKYILSHNDRLDSLYVLAWEYYPTADVKFGAAHIGQDFKYIAVLDALLGDEFTTPQGKQDPWVIADESGPLGEKDFAVRTDAAVKRIGKLLQEFNNDIPLTVMSNFLGEKAVTRAMEEQRIENYYDLYLTNPGSEYFFWLIALKLIIEDPAHCGAALPEVPYWRSVDADTVTVKVNHRLPVRMVADWCRVPMREIASLNVGLTGDAWGPGTYVLYVPHGTRKLFFDGLSSLRKKK